MFLKLMLIWESFCMEYWAESGVSIFGGLTFRSSEKLVSHEKLVNV